MEEKNLLEGEPQDFLSNVTFSIKSGFVEKQCADASHDFEWP
jgi:hypothetical protein